MLHLNTIAAITLFILLAASAEARALRCGTYLVDEGDLKIQVEEKCGKPITKEVVGYILRKAPFPGGSREREHLLEEWIYKHSKYYDVLTFEAGRLVRLEKIRR